MPFPQHPWPTTLEAAIPIQEEMPSLVISTDQLGPVQWVAGVDVGFEDQGRISRAAVVELDDVMVGLSSSENAS